MLDEQAQKISKMIDDEEKNQLRKERISQRLKNNRTSRSNSVQMRSTYSNF